MLALSDIHSQDDIRIQISMKEKHNDSCCQFALLLASQLHAHQLLQRLDQSVISLAAETLRL